MQDLINWLQTVEKLAATLYDEAAGFPGQDQKMAGFLQELAADENLHSHLLGSALNLFTEAGFFPAPAIAIDRETRSRVEEPLLASLAQISAGYWNREQLLTDLTQVEFSEWNHIFLYVLGACNEHFKEFQKISALIQAHEKKILDFLASLPDGGKHLARLQELPAIWRHRILVVEDNDDLREILCHVLAMDGEAVPAANGRIALELFNKQHFDMIISDISMPEMSCLEFFRQALSSNPELGGRLVFITGGCDAEAIDFAREHKITLLRKPFTLSELRQAAQRCLNLPQPIGQNGRGGRL